MDRVLYLDNAATSWPKPPETAQAMLRFMEAVGANPGRSGHRLSVEAARVVYGTRRGSGALHSSATACASSSARTPPRR